MDPAKFTRWWRELTASRRAELTSLAPGEDLPPWAVAGLVRYRGSLTPIGTWDNHPTPTRFALPDDVHLLVQHVGQHV